MEIIHSNGRFYIKTGNGEAELLYNKINSNAISIYHTFVPDKGRGKGIAEMLAKAAFEFAIKEKFKVRPDCPYIPHFLEKNPEYKKYIV
ncbi:MAG: GNAT family N-acetyltransferase [Candidatus Micrarchaeaceae archaeon]|jgi:uncharacterized protein